MREPATVLLNLAAGPGDAARRFERALPELEERYAVSLVAMDRSGAFPARIASALARGTRTFLAAGGDGTVHALAETLVRARGELPLGSLTLGAVGLGSSNDFHKPLRRGACGLPLRIDAEGAAPRDLARVTFRDAAGRERESVLVVSASIGVVAEANALFSRGGLRRRSTTLAIAWATLAAIARHRPLRLRLRVDGRKEALALSSLSILKTPWLSGALRYDVPVPPDDGRLAVAILEAAGRPRLLATLGGLLRGRFADRPGTRVLAACDVVLSADQPFLLEVDGETTLATEARFAVLPERIRACA